MLFHSLIEAIFTPQRTLPETTKQNRRLDCMHRVLSKKQVYELGIWPDGSWWYCHIWSGIVPVPYRCIERQLTKTEKDQNRLLYNRIFAGIHSTVKTVKKLAFYFGGKNITCNFLALSGYDGLHELNRCADLYQPIPLDYLFLPFK